MSDLSVVTIACYRDVAQLNEQTQALRLSCAIKATGVELWITQVGDPWHNFYYNKVIRFLDDLKSRRRRPKYLLYCDAADTLLLRDPAEIVTILGDYGKPIVIGAEAVCWPWPKRHGPQFENRPSGLSYPQAGVWLGEYDAVVGVLENIVRMVTADEEKYVEGKYEFRTEDQCCWTERIIKGDDIAIDTKARLVANMNNAPVDMFQMRDDGVRHTTTSQRPFVLHWAGGAESKQNLRDYARRFLQGRNSNV